MSAFLLYKTTPSHDACKVLKDKKKKKVKKVKTSLAKKKKKIFFRQANSS